MTNPARETVGVDAAQARIERLNAKYGNTESSRVVQAEMDRVHAENLAAVRKAAELTQIQLAHVMGVAQSEISRIENRQDLLLSTLASYLSAAGERPRVVVTIGGVDVELDLSRYSAAA